MESTYPYTRKTLLCFDAPALWQSPAYATLKPVEGTDLTVLPIRQGEKVMVGTTYHEVVAECKNVVWMSPPSSGPLPFELPHKFLMPFAPNLLRNWSGCYAVPGDCLDLPDSHNLQCYFGPNVVEFAILLCHRRIHYFLLIAPAIA